jgi:hypothetical protein
MDKALACYGLNRLKRLYEAVQTAIDYFYRVKIQIKAIGQ